MKLEPKDFFYSTGIGLGTRFVMIFFALWKRLQLVDSSIYHRKTNMQLHPMCIPVFHAMQANILNDLVNSSEFNNFPQRLSILISESYSKNARRIMFTLRCKKSTIKNKNYQLDNEVLLQQCYSSLSNNQMSDPLFYASGL